MPSIRACRLCGHDRFSPIETSPFSLVLCRRCGLLFARDIHDRTFYERLYRYHYSFAKNTKRVERRNRKYARWIRRNLPEDKKTRLIEIGCGGGNLLVEMQKENCNVFGIEPGTEAASHARQVRKLENIENCPLKETKHESKSFDAIVLVQTFEHLMDPIGSLDIIRRLLRDDGLLFIEVPDAYSLVGVYRLGLQPSSNHLFIYSKKTIRMMLETCGLAVVSMKRTPFNIRIVARKGNRKPVENHPQKFNPRMFLMRNHLHKAVLRVILPLYELSIRLYRNRKSFE